MTPAELQALFALIAVLEPEAVKLITQLVGVLHKHGATAVKPTSTTSVSVVVPNVNVPIDPTEAGS